MKYTELLILVSTALPILSYFIWYKYLREKTPTEKIIEALKEAVEKPDSVKTVKVK